MRLRAVKISAEEQIIIWVFGGQKFKILYFSFRLFCFCYCMKGYNGKELSICFKSSKEWLPVNFKIIFFLQPCFTNNCKLTCFPDKSITFCCIMRTAYGWVTYCIIPFKTLSV